jgi:hypothetical protein
MHLAWRSKCIHARASENAKCLGEGAKNEDNLRGGIPPYCLRAGGTCAGRRGVGEKEGKSILGFVQIPNN